jgi:hypothetical protein
MLTLRVTEERKRISSVTTYRAPHIDVNRAVNHQGPPIADRFTTTPHAAASTRRLTGPTQSWLAEGGF